MATLAEMPDGMSKKLHLHARRVTFPHPKGGTVDVTAPIPRPHAPVVRDMRV
jgi:23S rRNA pseudouridine955/2504/2580 synthase